MIEKRRQGRPKRGQNEVGAQLIIQEGRESMRDCAFDIQSRKELATAVGVTPALISYYFPKDVNLADVILSPVIFSHLQTLIRVVRSELTAADKLERLIHELRDAFRKDANLFDAYGIIAHNGRLPAGENLILQMQKVIAALVEECHRCGIPSPYPPSVQHGAIWGMCRAAADLDRSLAEETHITNRREETDLSALPVLSLSTRPCVALAMPAIEAAA